MENIHKPNPTAKAKILWTLALLSTASLLGLFFFGSKSKKEKMKVAPPDIENTGQAEQFSIANTQKVSSHDYESAAKPLFRSALEILDSDNPSQEKISDLREQMISLKLPKQYQEFHLRVILAFDQAEKSIKDGDKAKIREALEKMKKEEMANSWLK